jgi:hypothetical protein
MRKALYRTIASLDAASAIDIDRSKDDRDFFAAEKAKLNPVAEKVSAALAALEAFDITEGVKLQARVELGDQVLDNGVRAGNARTKLGLKGKSGLDSTHVFGQRVNDLVDEALHLQPSKVLAAAERLDDVPDFPDRSGIKADLIARADQQEKLLADRDAGDAKRSKLASAVVAAIVDGALALAQTKAALDGRFLRQRKYVASFFLDVSPARKKASPEDDGAAPDEPHAGNVSSSPA